MSVRRVAERYAKSLLDLADEQNILEQVEIDMDLFLKTCKENRELRLVLKNPIISHLKKVEILQGIFKGKVHDLTLSFFSIISRKSRENIIVEIAEEFQYQELFKKGIRKAELVTAVELDQKQKDSIVAMLAKSVGHKIQIEERIDPDLIGGFVIQMEGLQIDSSVKADLIRMRNKFNDSTYINKL